MKVSKILQDGNIFDAAVLDLTSETIIAKFSAAIKLQAQLSLAAGVPSAASAPHSVCNAFKNLVAVACASGYEFPQATKLLSAAASAPRGGAGPAAAAVVVEEVKKEEEETVDMGGLFGDDDDGY